jgi:UDP-N-acetylmuramoylalanine--D-glutamate ligase
MDLAHQKVLVVGFGKTGEALTEFLYKRGARVKISENKRADELEMDPVCWQERGVEVETGAHSLDSFLEADLIIPSPGVLPSLPELLAARAHGIKILSEIELAFRFLKGKIVGITGSNGKSTTATLAHKILKEAGLKSFLAGNIGTPLISFVDRSRDDHIYVTEISSFQLHFGELFKAPMAAFLNISVNHLDWHGSFEDYYAAKRKLLMGQDREDTAILNRDDRLVWGLRKEVSSRVFGFSRKRPVSRGCSIRDGWVVLSDKRDEKILAVEAIPLLGAHNQENVMAAAIVGHLFEVPAARMRRSIRDFQSLEHRLEKVLTLKGVAFVNDSKATSVDATIKALQSFDQQIVLILGGRDKGDDFTRLRKIVKEKVRKMILIGEAEGKIGDSLRGASPMAAASSMREAVGLGFASALPGDIVLLAPACTSFDMFRNFEDRGRVFKAEVRRLARKYKKERV